MKDDNLISRREFMKLFGSAAFSYIAASSAWSPARSLNGTAGGDFPNVLILLFDTLSAGNMSLYGYPRDTTPNMNSFAQRSFVYHRHISPGNFTTPATASLLTGVYPWRHRAVNLNGIVTKEFIDKNLFSQVKTRCYTTAYTHNPLAGLFLNQFSRHIHQLHEMKNLSRAGEVYADRVNAKTFPIAFWGETILRGTDQFFPGSLLFSTIEKNIHKLQAQRIETDLAEKYPNGIPYNYKGMYLLLEDAIDWIEDQLTSLPGGYLAYYHLWPPHDPYLPPGEFVNRYADQFDWPKKAEHPFSLGITDEENWETRRQYDEYIAFVDAEFGRLIEFMERENLLDNTLVVVTSDHGELFERGLSGHLNSTLYQNLLHVPLLISTPQQKARQDIYSATSGVDLLPTLLHYLGEKIPDFVDGEVLPGFRDGDQQAERSVFAMEAKLSGKNDPFAVCTMAVVKERYKLIRYQGYGEKLADELYDLDNDPEEMEDLSSTHTGLRTELGKELQRVFDGS
ncbi:MAG: sulfatase-like hydrolase/transferase [Chloroflexota bacterium]|nr:MAG: sulfatase-like hydrolase/transferase [Chloroflexota bacterium]